MAEAPCGPCKLSICFSALQDSCQRSPPFTRWSYQADGQTPKQGSAAEKAADKKP